MQSEFTPSSLRESLHSPAQDFQRSFSQVNRLWELREKPPIGQISSLAAQSMVEIIGFCANGHNLNFPLSTPEQPNPVDKAVNLLIGSFTHPPVPNSDYSYAGEIFLLLPKDERMMNPQDIIYNYSQVCREMNTANQSVTPLSRELKQRAAFSSLRMISLLGSTAEFQYKNMIASKVAGVIRNNHLGEEIGEIVGMKREETAPIPVVVRPPARVQPYRRPDPAPETPAALQISPPVRMPVLDAVPADLLIMPKRKKSLEDRVIEWIGKKIIPDTIKIKQRKRGVITTVTEPLIPQYKREKADEKLDPYEMKESELQLGEISVISFDTPSYGEAEIMVDARGAMLDESPTVIDTRGKRVRLKRVKPKGEKGSSVENSYAICMRFDSFGRATYFEDDGSKKYHAKVKLTFTPDSGGVFKPKLSYFISNHINTAGRTLGADDHLREIADLEYGYCQDRNGLLSMFAVERNQEDEVLLHLFTGQKDIDPGQQSANRDELLNKILIPSLPLDPTTLGMTILSDSGADVIHPVNYAFHPALFPSAGRLSQGRAKLAGIRLKHDELLFDILAVKGRDGRFLLFDGSIHSAVDCVEIFIVRKKAGSDKRDKILIIDKSLAEGENPAPFQSGVRAGKLKVGERMDFEKREILLTPEAKIEVSANQVFEVRLGEREDDPLVTVHSPVIPGDKPQISYYNANWTAGNIEVEGRLKPIRRLFKIKHENRNDVSPEVVSALDSISERKLYLNPMVSTDLKLALSGGKKRIKIFGFTTTINDKGEVEPAGVPEDDIKGRTFIFSPNPVDGKPNNYTILQLDLPQGETFCGWDKAVVKEINPIESSLVNSELAYISGTASSPASCEIGINDDLFYTPLVIAGKLRGRQAIIEGVIDRRKTGRSLDLVDITTGVRRAINPAGAVVRVLDDEVRKILASQDGQKSGILNPSQVYVVGIRRGRRGKGFVDLSTDIGYLNYLRAKKTENKEAKILLTAAVRAIRKGLHIGEEYEGMSKIIILEDHKTKRRSYHLFDQSRSTFAESSFSAGLGVRIGSKDERSRIAQIRDYQDKVVEEKRRRRAKRARLAQTLSASLSLAGLLGGGSLSAVKESGTARVPPQPVPIIFFIKSPEGVLNLPVSTGESDLYSPVRMNAFDYESSVQIDTFNPNGIRRSPSEGVVLSGGQVVLEGAGVAVSGITDLEGKSVTLFASNQPIPFPVGGESKDRVLQPAVYTAFDIDGNLGYRNDNNEVRLLELNNQDNNPVLDTSGNPIRFTRTALQSGLFAGATLYQAALPSGDIIYIDPADIENIYDGNYDAVPVYAAHSKVTGKTYWFKTGENIQKPTHDLFTRWSADQITGTTNPNKDVSFDEINMGDLFYEPAIYADKNGQIVARKDIGMSLTLARLNASIYQTEGDKPVVYRYFENGKPTNRFITVFQGKMEEVAREVSPGAEKGSPSETGKTIIVYKTKLRLMPEQSRLQEFRQKFDAFVEEVWVSAEILQDGTAAKDIYHFNVYDPQNPGKVIGFYRYTVLPGIEENRGVNPAGNIGYYKKYSRVDFKGIDESYYVSQDQLSGAGRTTNGVVYGLADTLGFTDIYGRPVAYLVDDSIDTLGIRTSELHPPNIFVVEEQGHIIYRFDNKYYISGQNDGFTYDFDHLPTPSELKSSLPENVSSRFVKGNIEAPESKILTFQRRLDHFIKMLIPGVEARSNSAESYSAEKQLIEFSAYIDQAVKDAFENKITSGVQLARYINHQLIYYGLDETYLLGNREYQQALEVIAGSSDSVGVEDSRIRSLKTAFVPFFQNDGNRSFAGDESFTEASNFNNNSSNPVYEARLPEGSVAYNLSISVPVFELQIPNADGSYEVQRNPGIAMVTIDSDGKLLGEFNPTRILGEYPIPMGSTIKPLEYAFFKYLELLGRPILIDGQPLDLHKTPVNYAPGQYSVDGSQLPSYVVNAYDKLNSSAGDPRMTMDQALAVSANVPFQFVMRKFMEQNPGGWQEWQAFLGKLGMQMVDLQGNVLDKATPLAAIGSDVYITNLKSMGLAFAIMTAPEKTLTDQAMITALQLARDTLMNDEIKLQFIGVYDFRMGSIGRELLSSTISGQEGVFGGKTGTVGGGVNGTTHVLSMGFVKMPDGKFVVAVAIEAGQTIGSDGSSKPTDLLKVIDGPYGSTMVMPWLRQYLTQIYKERLSSGESTRVSQDVAVNVQLDAALKIIKQKGYEALTPAEAVQVFSTPQQQFVYDLSLTINRLLDERVTDKIEFRDKLQQSLAENYPDMVDSPEFNSALDIFIADMYSFPGQPVQCMDFLFLVQKVFGTGDDGLPHLSGQTRELPDAEGSLRVDAANDLIDTEFAGIPFIPGSDTPTVLNFQNYKEIRITKLSQIQEGDFIIIADQSAGHIAYAVKIMTDKDGKPVMILAQSNKEVTQEGSFSAGRPDIITVSDQNFQQLVGKFGNVFILRNPKFVPPQSELTGKKAPVKGRLGTIIPFPALGMIVAQRKGRRRKPKKGKNKLKLAEIFSPDLNVDLDIIAKREYEKTHPPNQLMGNGKSKSGGQPAKFTQQSIKPKGYQPGLRHNR